MSDRALSLDLTFNTRDLGGIPTWQGRPTPMKVFVRSDGLERLTAHGWRQVIDYGIRTIVDLTNDGEVPADSCPRPSSLHNVRVALDGDRDPTFWSKWPGAHVCTPSYFKAHLERFPELTARVLKEIAKAPAGGVLVHCAGGRDRTGLISALLLLIGGVAAKDIAHDHSLSYANVSRRHAVLGTADDTPGIAEFLEAKKTTTSAMMLKFLSEAKIMECLSKGGLTDGDVDALRARWKGSPV